jgi:hypothetical protein
MWNPKIDYVPIQGCRFCFLHLKVLSLNYPEPVTEIRNLVLYVEDGLCNGFTILMKTPLDLGAEHEIPSHNVDVVELLARDLQSLRNVTLIIEHPAEWPTAPKNPRRKRGSNRTKPWRLTRKLRIGNGVSVSANSKSPWITQEVRLAVNDNRMLEGFYKNLGTHYLDRSLVGAVTKFQEKMC